MSELVLACDRRMVSICRATSERVASGPDGTSSANNEEATMRPHTIHAKVITGPPITGGNGRQII